VAGDAAFSPKPERHQFLGRPMKKAGILNEIVLVLFAAVR
jgi:hypothetical protein